MSNSIEFTAGIDVSPMRTGAEQMQAIALRSFGKIRAGSTIAFGAIAGASALAFHEISKVAAETSEKVRAVFERGDELSDLSKQTGIAAGRLYMMQLAFKKAGVDADGLGRTVNKMQLFLGAAAKGSSTAQTAFQQIGLDWRMLTRLSPDRQFQAVAASIGNLSDPAARATAAINLFGRAGADLLPLFNDRENIEAMGGVLSGKAAVYQRSAERFEIVSKKLAELGRRTSGIVEGIAEGVVPGLIQVLAAVKGVDFIGIGQKVGAYLGMAASFMARMVPILFAAEKAILTTFLAGGNMIVGYALQFADAAWRGAQVACDLFKAGMQSVIASAKEFAAEIIGLPVTFTAHLNAGLRWAFQNATEFFGNGLWDVIANLQAGLQYAFQQAMAGLSKVPGLNKILGLKDFKSETFQVLQDAAKAANSVHKTGYKAESFSDIDNQEMAKTRNALPGIAKLMDSLHAGAVASGASAAESFNRAMSAHGSFLKRDGGKLDAEAWKKNGGRLYDSAADQLVGLPARLAKALHPVVTAAAQVHRQAVTNRRTEEDPWNLASRSQWGISAFAGDAKRLNLEQGLRTPGLGGSAYGFSRHSAAGRAAAAREADRKTNAVKAAAEKDKAKTSEGTNERLDSLLGAFSEAWGTSK